MKRMTAIAAALAPACVVVGLFAGSLLAQEDAGVYGACARGKEKIPARALPSTAKTGVPSPGA